MAAIVTPGLGLEDSSSTVLRQMVGQDGEFITLASIDTLKFRVHDILDPGNPVETIALTTLTPISDFIFDTPINDSRWTQDSKGYNFRLILPANAFPLPNTHRVNVLVTWSNGDPDVNFPFDIAATPSFGP